MDENRSLTDGGSDEKGASGRVGETIRRGRITKKISLQSLAEDLKLNETYVRALEEGSYEDLPPLPYTKGYILSIARYLGLDAEDLLAQFLKETDAELPTPDAERHGTMSISVQKERSQFPFFAVFVVVGILLIFILLLQGREEVMQQVNGTSVELDTTNNDPEPSTIDEVEEVEEVAVEGNLDTLLAATAIEEPQQEVVEPIDTRREFRLSVVRDSTWVEYYYDGIRGESGIYRRGDEIVVSAQDSVSVRVGLNSAVRYSIDGKTVEVPGTRTRISNFLMESGDFVAWNHARWNRTY